MNKILLILIIPILLLVSGCGHQYDSQETSDEPTGGPPPVPLDDTDDDLDNSGDELDDLDTSDLDDLDADLDLI